MDGGAIYAVQEHEVRDGARTNLATVDYVDVLVWDFARAAKKRWLTE